MSTKLVTVLVGIYKARQFVQAKIDNLLAQDIFKQSWIVLLNCQNLENEDEIYREFLYDHDNVLEIKYSSHVRLYSSWNDGIILTSSEYICNSNIDDMWHPQFLNRCTKFLTVNRDYACVSTQILVTKLANQHDASQWSWHDRMPQHAYPKSTAGPCPVWRRNLHHKYGYFDDYRVIGDAKMWEKWRAGGEKFALLKDDLVLYYVSGRSLERRVDDITGKSLRSLDCEET